MKVKHLVQLLLLEQQEADVAIGNDVAGFHGPEKDYALGPIWALGIVEKDVVQIGRFMRNERATEYRRTCSDFHGIEQPNVYYPRVTRNRT